MPSMDSRDQIVGHVLRELKNGRYVKTYLVLNFETHHLLGYPGNIAVSQSGKELSEIEPDIDINCQWITKVCNASSRPRVLHCLEIGLPTGSQFLSVDSEEERDEWAESIRRCSMGQSSGKPAVSAMQAAKKDGHVAYHNVVVGGKVQKVPIQPNGSSAAESSALARSGSGGQTVKRTRGFPRVISAGHGIKLGAVMKNWKKRFFVLTEVSLGYYKSIEEAEPIRTISVGDMSSCVPSKEIPGKEHMFELVTPSRTYYIQVETEEEVEEWVKAFRSLIRTIRGSHQPHPPSPDSPLPLQDSASDDDIDLVGTLV